MRVTVLLLLLTFTAYSCKRVSIDIDSLPVAEKKAILILPGLLSIVNGPRAQRKYFENRGYDVFIPKFLSRTSIDDNYKLLVSFIKKHKLNEYGEVHVFSYIAGAYPINRWIRENENHNIKTVVYDKSPLQENAPVVMTRKFPRLSMFLFGEMIWDLRDAEYLEIENSEEIAIGFLIETKGTGLVFRGREYFTPLTSDDWNHTLFGQDFDDFCYLWVSHNELYKEFDVVGPEILHFFREGKFTKKAPRKRSQRDPFESRR